MRSRPPPWRTRLATSPGRWSPPLEDVSNTWANDANGVITTTTNDINKDVFGWVVNATAAVNDTLNTFEDEVNKASTPFSRERRWRTRSGTSSPA